MSGLFPLSFPVLETPRLLLKAPKESDAEAILEMMSNPNVMRYYDWEAHKSKEDSLKLIQILNQRYEDKIGLRWFLWHKERQEIIGFAGFYKIELEHDAGLGYGLKEEFWNKGIMHEALQKILSYGFAQLQLHRVYAEVMPANSASQKLLQKLGFLHEGTLRESKYFKEKINDMSLFALLQRDWNKFQTSDY